MSYPLHTQPQPSASAVALRHAPRILHLAKAALVIVQALLDAEHAARAETGHARTPLFEDEQVTLTDVQHGLSVIEARAEYLLLDVRDD